MSRSERRIKLQDAAARVAYQHGLVGMTLATVAEAAGVPLGGIYYYYKTRDDMVVSIVERMEDQIQGCMAGFEAAANPAEALKAFVDYVLGNGAGLVRFGCPIGTLSAQLRKEPGEVGQRMGAILGQLAGWSAEQFLALGLEGGAARAAGRGLLVRLQGAAMMAHATGDATYVSEITEALEGEIDRLAGECR